jgi:UDP-GlcNAc:undecaprenyl-phosphate/decaprenyl-phosphate GlcNAc-1-phosphate transferase
LVPWRHEKRLISQEIDAVLSFFSAFLICLVLTPFLIRYAARRKWFDVPDQRKIHEEETPRLGGVAIAGSLLISIFLTADPDLLFTYRYFLAGLLMLFFVGVWDDLQPVKPLVKLVGELLPVILLSVTVQIDFSTLHPAFARGGGASIIITAFAAFWMVNAFNLIDGINGLAGTIGILASFFTAWMIPAAAPLCLSLAGALLAFLFYNFRNPLIFMGDSGSLLVGYCLVFAFTFPANNTLTVPVWIAVLPLVSIPLFDMARVFIVRLSKGSNPFKPDRNHLHHLLLEIGMSHMGATGILAILTLLNTGLVYLLIHENSRIAWMIIVTTFIPLLFTWILWQRVKKIRNRQMLASRDAESKLVGS